jgi:hypothetical protein
LNIPFLSTHYLRKTNFEVIQPVNHQLVRYWYSRVTYKQDVPDLDLKSIVKKYDVYAEADIPLTATETVNMRLKILKKGDKIYTMQYRDDSKQLKIRTDSAHDFPHIDIELPGQKQDKRKLKNPPSDYESSINTILRIAEQMNNPLIGPTYWLFPSAIFKSQIIASFPQFQAIYNVKTAYTDIARFASIKAINETRLGKTLGVREYMELIRAEFEECGRKEELNGGIPLEATEIIYPKDIILMPFNIVAPPSSNIKMILLDADGNQIDATRVKDLVPAGMVMEKTEGARKWKYSGSD